MIRWRSRGRDSADMLLARILVLAPNLSSLVVAAPRQSKEASDVGRDLFEAARKRGLRTRLLDVSDQEHVDGNASKCGADFASINAARSAIRLPDTVTIVIGGGILDDP